VRESTGQSPRSVKQPINIKGCMQKKTNDDGDQLLMLNIHADVIPLYHNSNSCHVVQVERPNDIYDPEQQTALYTNPTLKSVTEWTRFLSNTDMDVIVIIDSCCIKKTGGVVDVLPKIKAYQVVVTKQQQQNKRHIGLKLVRQ
jgi:hypothetical protein